MALFTCLLVLSASSSMAGVMLDRLDRLNTRLVLEGALPEIKIERMFREAVAIAFHTGFLDEIEARRESAFETDDFRQLDSLIERAAPAIVVLSAGESVSAGVNTTAFMLKCAPGTPAWEFFDLADDGFYSNGENGVPGIASLPVWMERGESSAVAVMKPDVAAVYLEIWRSKLPDFTGYFREIALETLAGLEKAAGT